MLVISVTTWAILLRLPCYHFVLARNLRMRTSLRDSTMKTATKIFLHKISNDIIFMQNPIKFVRSEALTTVIMNNSIFWDITLFNQLKVNRRFGGRCRIYLQGLLCLLHAPCSGFLLGLFFDPEDGGDIFLLNLRWLSATTQRYIAEDGGPRHNCLGWGYWSPVRNYAINNFL
jgi:hypothetical protein